MKNNDTAGEALDLNKLAAIADRVEARGLFNAACDIRDWIQEVHAALARAGSAAPTGQQAEPVTCGGCDPAEGYCRACREAERAATKAASPADAPTMESLVDALRNAALDLLELKGDASAKLEIAGEPPLYVLVGHADGIAKLLPGAAPAPDTGIPTEGEVEKAGWKWVPIEPTEDMFVAFAETWFSKTRPIDDCGMDDCYAAMLAAAPSHPSEAKAGEDA